MEFALMANAVLGSACPGEANMSGAQLDRVVLSGADPGYFAQRLVPPVGKVYVATIQAGAASKVALALAVWAVPAAARAAR
jgi:hypothetical protein